MMENIVKYLDETEAAIRKAVERLDDVEDRERVLCMANQYVKFLTSVQRMPLVARLQYYRVAFALYELLRRNKQLGRRVGEFDETIKREIEKTLGQMWK